MEYTSTNKNTKIERLNSPTAILYVRVSSIEQVNNFSIPTQLKECRKYLSDNKIVEVGTFIEQGESAKSADRTQFQNLLTFLKNNKNKVDYLVCYKFDRFSRNTLDFLYYKNEIGKYGTVIKSITEAIDDSSTGRLLQTIYAGLAQFDNENKGERVKHCLRTKALDGWYPSVAPYGYINNKETHRLEPDSLYFKHVKYALTQFSSGFSIPDIVTALNKFGLKTLGRRKSGNKEITSKVVWKILNNSKFYAGYFDWKDEKDIKGKHKTMITWSEHLKIQEKLHTKPTKIVRNEDDDFILNFTIGKEQGYLHCSQCGWRMRSCNAQGRGGKYSYYYCFNPGCKQEKKSILKKKLEDKFRKSLRKLTPLPETIELFKEIVKEEWEKQHTQEKELVTQSEQRLNLLDREKADTIAMRRRRELDESDYLIEMSRIKAEITQITAPTDPEHNPAQIDALLDSAEEFLTNLEPLFNAYPMVKKRDLAQIVFPQGVVYGNGKYRTPEKSVLFNTLEDIKRGNLQFLGVQGIEP